MLTQLDILKTLINELYPKSKKLRLTRMVGFPRDQYVGYLCGALFGNSINRHFASNHFHHFLGA